VLFLYSTNGERIMMVHYLERRHDERVTKLMDDALPDLRARRDLLNGAPLAAESWS